MLLAALEVDCITHVQWLISPTTPKGCAASCRFWTAHEVAAISSHSGINLSGLACTEAVGVWTKPLFDMVGHGVNNSCWTLCMFMLYSVCEVLLQINPHYGLQAVPSNLCSAPGSSCRTHANCYSGRTWRLTLRAMKVAFWKSFILLSIFFFFMAKTSGASTLPMTCTQASTQ